MNKHIKAYFLGTLILVISLPLYSMEIQDLLNVLAINIMPEKTIQDLLKDNSINDLSIKSVLPPHLTGEVLVSDSSTRNSLNKKTLIDLIPDQTLDSI